MHLTPSMTRHLQSAAGQHIASETMPGYSPGIGGPGTHRASCEALVRRGLFRQLDGLLDLWTLTASGWAEVASYGRALCEAELADAKLSMDSVWPGIQALGERRHEGATRVLHIIDNTRESA